MELSKVVVLKVAVLLFLLGLTATVDARFDAGSFTQLLTKGYAKYTTEACCDKCSCTKSYPPICRCDDLGETCHSACKKCICVWLYWPLRLQCNCLDETDFCYPPCTSSGAKYVEAH